MKYFGVNRTTNVRVAYTGVGNYQWLNKKEVEIAETMGIKFYPTVHRADDEYEPVEVECPTPEICGYWITLADWDRIRAVKELFKTKKSKK